MALVQAALCKGLLHVLTMLLPLKHTYNLQKFSLN